MNQSGVVNDQTVRMAALVAAAAFCGPVEASETADVVRIAKQFEGYIRTGELAR